MKIKIMKQLTFMWSLCVLNTNDLTDLGNTANI